MSHKTSRAPHRSQLRSKTKDTYRPIRKADTKASALFRVILLIFCLGFTLFFYFIPLTAYLKFTTFIAWASVIIAILRMSACLSSKPAPDASYEADTFPLYTILVPLFHEANMVEELMENLEQFNYPKDKLEIFLICETVDQQTVTEVKRHLRSPFRLIIVPKGTPQTKPRALNYAFQFSKGAYITIYDAEDRPHPDQLNAALKGFQMNKSWSALQAPLDYFNVTDSLLSRQFTLEYAALFHVWLPFLTKLGIPFPLGGTSNHMKREALELCEGWDAHNVTEDADLSFRIAAHGGKIGYITPPTKEEAVSTLGAWNDQRSRWMKGYLQTWVTHMHRPLEPHSIRGLLRLASLQLTIAYVLIAALIFTPVIFSGLIYLVAYFITGWTLPFSSLHFIAFGLSLFTGILIGIVGAYRAGQKRLMIWALAMPAYWLLLFWPTLRALAELQTRPFHWHKTAHGVSPSRKFESNKHI